MKNITKTTIMVLCVTLLLTCSCGESKSERAQRERAERAEKSESFWRVISGIGLCAAVGALVVGAALGSKAKKDAERSKNDEQQ